MLCNRVWCVSLCDFCRIVKFDSNSSEVTASLLSTSFEIRDNTVLYFSKIDKLG